jgi:hypothetical protein
VVVVLLRKIIRAEELMLFPDIDAQLLRSKSIKFVGKAKWRSCD